MAICMLERLHRQLVSAQLLVPAAATLVPGPLIPAFLQHVGEMDRCNGSMGTLHTELQLLIEVLITFVKQVNLNCDL